KRKAELIGRRSLEHGYPHRRHVMGALAIGDLILQRSLYWRRRRCLTACGLYRTHGSRRGATLQKFPSTSFFRVHASLLRDGSDEMYAVSTTTVNNNASAKLG